MRIDLLKSGSLLIVPETAFESRWLEVFTVDKAYREYGRLGKDFLGIVIKRKVLDSSSQEPSVSIPTTSARDFT